MYIKLDDIIPNRFQPREIFDEVALNELADSIKNHGVLEPILVRPVGNKYEIIAGERRYKASALAGLTSIPALVKQMDDKESSIVAFIENAQRKDVSAIESARTAQRILKTNNMTQEDLAKSLGISQSYLANKLRLLTLPLEIQDALMKGEISERHARSLLSLKDESKQIELLKKIKENKMTVRELDGEIKSMNNGFLNIGNEMPNNNGNEQKFESFLNNGVNNFGSAPVETIDNPPVQDTTSFLNGFDINANNNDSAQQNDLIVNNSGFMEYLNDNNNTNPPTNPEPNTMTTQPNNFTNNYDNNSLNQLPPSSHDDFTTTGTGFMSFLNAYDDNNPLPPEPNGVPSGGMVGQPAPADNSFMEYLNSNDNNPIPPAPSVMNTNQSAGNDDFMTTGNNFMEYLNDYDSNIPSSPATSETPSSSQSANNLDSNFTNFLNNYDNKPVFNEPNIDKIQDYSAPSAPASINANSYVEDNPNYVDVSRQQTFNSVDEIIDDLKTEINKIKGMSKFKIDTDEINFDDIYQVTIKIDKRDF